MVKKHPVLCLLGWTLFCFVAYVFLDVLNANFAGLLFFFYMYDHGAELISKQFGEEDKK